jgi:G3E family GTPase
MVLLNKAAEVEPEELERIRQIVRTIQPQAEIIDCNYGDVPLERLLNTGAFDFEKVATSATWIHEIEKPHEDEDEDEEDEHKHEHEHEHEHEHHHHHGDEDTVPPSGGGGGLHHHHHHHHEGEGEALEYGIGTFVYYRREPMDLGRFDEFVARHWPKSVIRAKGVCYFHDEQDVCYVFEQAGRQVSIKNAGQWYATMPKEDLEYMLSRDATLRHDWDDYYGDRMQKIVFIGQKMDRKAIEEALDKCLRK